MIILASRLVISRIRTAPHQVDNRALAALEYMHPTAKNLHKDPETFCANQRWYFLSFPTDIEHRCL